MELKKPCPHCGENIVVYRNPAPTVDVIIFVPGDSPEQDGVVLVERANEPHGWALPGGFVDYGETCENAAVREMKEETGLDVVLTGLFGVYSDPDRDPRSHTMSVIYHGFAKNIDGIAAGDDAAKAQVFPLSELPQLVFDHDRILADFIDLRTRLTP